MRLALGYAVRVDVQLGSHDVHLFCGFHSISEFVFLTVKTLEKTHKTDNQLFMVQRTGEPLPERILDH